eukprot:3938426-Rhodomonas_salina.3
MSSGLTPVYQMVELMQILRSPYMIKTPKDKMNVNLVSTAPSTFSCAVRCHGLPDTRCGGFPVCQRKS